MVHQLFGAFETPKTVRLQRQGLEKLFTTILNASGDQMLKLPEFCTEAWVDLHTTPVSQSVSFTTEQASHDQTVTISVRSHWMEFTDQHTLTAHRKSGHCAGEARMTGGKSIASDPEYLYLTL